MALNFVSVVLDLTDGEGNLVTFGSAQFVPSAILTDVPDGVIITQQPVQVPFTSGGSPSAKLLATDNASPAPSGWTWGASFNIGGGITPYNFFLPAGPASFTATSATPAVFTWTPTSAFTAAGLGTLPNGTGVQLSGGSLPAGFSAAMTYYVVASSGSTFQLAATPGGSPIASTSAGSGNVTVVQYNLSSLTPTASVGASSAFLLASKNLSDVANAATARSNLGLAGISLQRVDGPVVASGTAVNGLVQSNGTDTGVNTRAAYTAVSDMSIIQAVYLNGSGSTPGEYTPAQYAGTPITVTAALEYSSGDIVPLTFGGQISVTIPYWGMVTTDPASVAIPAGATFWIRTFGTVASGNKWNVMGWAPGGYTASGGVAQTDLTQSGTITGSYASPFMPSAIRGIGLSPNTLRIAGVGDSITGGLGDSGQALGWFARAFTGYRYIRLGLEREQLTAFSPTSRNSLRMAMARGCNAAFGMYGANDFANGASAASIEQALIWLFRQMQAQGMTACYGATIPPRTTSTDNWATTANQTVTANEAVRVALNGWIRAGMPVNSSLTPIAVGTSGALLAGQPGHPVLRVYDLCSVCETSRDSGIWPANGTAFAYTPDGIHPSATSYANMAALISVPQILADLNVAS